MPGVHCSTKGGCGLDGPDAPPKPKPPPGGKQKCSPGAGRTSNGDCIPPKDTGELQGAGQARNKREWMAHPSKALKRIAAGHTGNFYPDPKYPDWQDTVAMGRIVARLHAKVDRHAAVVARRQARNASRDHLA